MGTYLTNGIVQNITIEKRKLEHRKVTIAAINESLKQEINIDCYNQSEDATAYYWTIKPEMLKPDLAKFLDTQFQMYSKEKDRYMQDVIDELTKVKTAEEITEIAKNKGLSRFQFIDNIMEHIKVVQENGFDTSILVHYSLISYFLDGKIIMECYGRILKYFERNIRLQRDKYPIVDCVKVMITS
jgi:hypothetical protein